MNIAQKNNLSIAVYIKRGVKTNIVLEWKTILDNEWETIRNCIDAHEASDTNQSDTDESTSSLIAKIIVDNNLAHSLEELIDAEQIFPGQAVLGTDLSLLESARSQGRQQMVDFMECYISLTDNSSDDSSDGCASDEACYGSDLDSSLYL